MPHLDVDDVAEAAQAHGVLLIDADFFELSGLLSLRLARPRARRRGPAR